MLLIVLDFNDFSEFLRNIDYANAAMAYEFAMARDTQKQKDEYNSLLGTLKDQIQEQYPYLDECADVNNEVNMMLLSLKSILPMDQYIELQDIAYAITEIQCEAEKALNRGEGLSDSLKDENSPVIQSLQNGLNIRVNRSNGSGIKYTDEWKRGLAGTIRDTDEADFVSAKDFPNMNNEDMSECGFIGVSIPESWGDYTKYYNHLVRIKYNGCEVLGIINGTGDLANGSRSLELQSGLIEGPGFRSPDEFGVREVE